jgi:hypothetical protein
MAKVRLVASERGGFMRPSVLLIRSVAERYMG